MFTIVCVYNRICVDVALESGQRGFSPLLKPTEVKSSSLEKRVHVWLKFVLRFITGSQCHRCSSCST